MLDAKNCQRHATQTVAVAILSLGLVLSGPAWAAETQGAPAAISAPGKTPPAKTSGGHAETTAGGAPHWEYTGDAGPQYWGSLAPEFSACSAGSNQSPIDIQRIYTGSEPRIQFNYRPSRLHVVNNGHTIQVNYDPGSFIKIDDRTFELLQFHFHTPSEHTVKGKAYDMELHFVHRSAEGTLAVVGVLMQRGAVNEALQDVWEHLPGMAGEERNFQTLMINAADMLPPTGNYYVYSGSLTTPPCSEGVRWNLLATPAQISDAQVATFKRLFPLNARPVQPIKERFIINVVGPKS